MVKLNEFYQQLGLLVKAKLPLPEALNQLEKTLKNGLKLDRHNEELAVEMFSANIIKAGEIFMENPQETPFIPCWNRVISAIPDFMEKFQEAVELDNKE